MHALMMLLGWLWWTVLPVRKRAALSQLRASGLDCPPGPTLRRAVGSAALGYLELLLGRRARWHNTETVAAAISGRGGICLAGHGGAWDLAMVSCAHHLPLTVYVREPSSAVARRALLWLRERTGADLELLPPGGGLADAERALARGRLVVLVQDQRHNGGLPVPFFGRPAWTSAGFAVLAHRHPGLPLFGAWQRRTDSGLVEGIFEQLHWERPTARAEAVAELTARSQQWVEGKVRGAPADWWWLHKRWKVPPGATVPPGESS